MCFIDDLETVTNKLLRDINTENINDVSNQFLNKIILERDDLLDIEYLI